MCLSILKVSRYLQICSAVCLPCSFLPDAHSATIVAPESMGVGTQISHLDTKIHTQEEQGDRKLEDKIHLPANNQKLKEELTEAYKTLTKAEQEHQSDDEDGLSIANTSCLHNDALHDLPDGVKNDLDAHIKNCEAFVY